jgi:hypothetical protein
MYYLDELQTPKAVPWLRLFVAGRECVPSGIRSCDICEGQSGDVTFSHSASMYQYSTLIFILKGKRAKLGDLTTKVMLFRRWGASRKETNFIVSSGFKWLRCSIKSVPSKFNCWKTRP